MRERIRWVLPAGRRNGKRTTLTKQISRIVLVLILVGIMEGAAAYTMLDWYHNQVAELEYTISDIYLSETDQNFNLIDTSVRSMIYNGEEVREVLQASWIPSEYMGETERLAYTLEKNNSVSQLKSTFRDMVGYYGNRFNFFFLDMDNQVMVEHGGSEYGERQPFLDQMRQLVEENEVSYTSNGRWFLQGDYLCTIHQGQGGIGGAYIRAEDFALSMLRMSPTQCSSIEIYDTTSGSALIYERQKNGTLSEVIRAEETELPQDCYRMKHAGVVCRFVMDTSGYEKTVLLPVLFMALLGLYLVTMAIAWLYTRRKVLGQVSSFYNHLIEYKDTERFCEDMGVEEFAEAGRVLNQRSDEISQLKISVYEEQINRQKVELDYAQLQIRPHFYINCLNIIHSMAQEKLTREIQEFVVHISRYFRYIFKKGMEPVTVEKELEFTETYLKILECMNDTTYRYEVSCEEGLSEVRIPPLIVQTFVENAVKHNLDGVQDCEIRVYVECLCGDAESGEPVSGGTVTGDNRAESGVSAGDAAGAKTGEPGRKWLRILVLDNGRGFDDETLARFGAGDFGEEGTGYHIGIRNAVARMKMIYGRDACVTFSNREDRGACVEIRIPLTE